MNKKVFLLLLIFSILNCGAYNDTVYAKENYIPPPLEEFFSEIGYKTVEEAIKEFEQHFKQDLKLPLRIPPIPFTHIFGRFNDLDGDMNDSLDIEFINEKSSENHYKIDIRHLKNKVKIRDKGNQQIYKLKNGQKAIFITDPDRVANTLVFEKDNWQYMLGVNKWIANKVTPEILVEIANSIDY